MAKTIVSNGVWPTRSKATCLERFLVAEVLLAPANAFSRRLNHFNAPVTHDVTHDRCDLDEGNDDAIGKCSAFVAIDSLEISRQNVLDEIVEARIQLTFYFESASYNEP